jgi:hypothetical protein
MFIVPIADHPDVHESDLPMVSPFLACSLLKMKRSPLFRGFASLALFLR